MIDNPKPHGEYGPSRAAKGTPHREKDYQKKLSEHMQWKKAREDYEREIGLVAVREERIAADKAAFRAEREKQTEIAKEKNAKEIAALIWAERQAHPSQRKKISGIRESLEKGHTTYDKQDVFNAWFPAAKKYAAKELKNDGWVVDHKSDSGSIYFKKGDVRIRVSDHQLGFADYGSREQVHGGPEVVLTRPLDPGELMQQIRTALKEYSDN